MLNESAEKIPIHSQQDNEAVVNEDEEIEEDKPEDINNFEIMTYPADTTLKGYKELWDTEQLKNPSFQRQYVWDQTRAGRLIESFLLGLAVPGVFLYKERNSSKYLVIDGQQRIRTVVSFLKGYFDDNRKKKFILKKVSSQWVGKSFKDLTSEDQFKLETAVMRATIIQQLNPKDNSSIYQIFERLNTGGINLNPMEVRMCVSAGKFVDMLKDLNQNPKWRKLYNPSETQEHKRSKDKELILRTLALSEGEYIAPMKRFLNEYLDKNKDTGGKEINKKREIFLRAVEKAGWLGEKPFHLEKTRGLNFSLADSVLVALMESPINDKALICEAYNKLLSDEKYLQLVKRAATSKTRTNERLRIAKDIFSHG